MMLRLTLLHLMSDLRLGFFNSQGCNSKKFDILTSQIPSDFDLLVIAETWNCDEPLRRQHPFFVISSIPRHQSRTHNSGGLMLLCSPKFKPFITATDASHHHISFTIFNTSFSAFYLPPSLNLSSFTSTFKSALSFGSQIFLGDINVRFGKIVGDSTIVDRPRYEFISRFRLMNNLILHKPSNIVPIRDHLLTTPSFCPSYEYIPHPTIRSDHSVMHITFPQLSSPGNPSFTIPKFILTPLQFCGARTQLREDYNSAAPPPNFLMYLLRYQSQERLVKLSRQDRLDLVNFADEVICSSLLNLCHGTLGTYPATPPNTSLRSPRPPGTISTPLDAIRYFKSSQRSLRTFVNSRDTNLTPMEDGIRHFQEVYTSLPDSFEDQPPVLPTSIPDLETLLAFSTANVKEAIRKYPSQKSGGLDGIQIKLLKYLVNSNLPLHLSHLFSLCVVTGVTPSRWNESLITPIPKIPEATSITDMRPVSLTIMFRRLFEVLTHRLIQKSDPIFADIHPLQGGFVRHLGPPHQALIAHESAIRTETPAIHIFFDFKTAYDRVNICLLLEKLKYRSCPQYLQSIFHHLFTPQSSRLALNGNISESFQRQCGLFQGSILAPLLFNIFIDDLLDSVIRRDVYVLNPMPFPPLLLFADDIKGYATEVDEAQELVDCVGKWALENEMTLNIKKCGVIGLAEGEWLVLNGKELPVVSEYKYLGFPFSADGILVEKFVDNMIGKAKRTLSFLKATSCGWSELIKLTVYKIFVRSMTEYGLPFLWSYSRNMANKISEKFWSKIESIQDTFIDWIFPSKSPAKSRIINRSILGLPPLSVRAQSAALTFHHRLQNLKPRTSINILMALLDDHPIPWQKSKLSLARSLRQCLPYRGFLKEKEEDEDLTLKRYCRRLEVSALNPPNYKLPSYIIPSCRFKGYSYDRILRIPDPHLRNFCIKWRRNVWFFGDQSRRNCIITDTQGPHRFDRGCIDRCRYLDYWLTVDVLEKNEIETKFMIDKVKRFNGVGNYCIMDFLLNKRKYRLVEMLFDVMEMLAPLVDEDPIPG
jgi:hypothetical protein